MKSNRLIIALVSVFLLGSCNAPGTNNINNSDAHAVKNIIFLIGDGMGVAHVQAAMNAAENSLNMETAEFTGLCKTNSKTHKITDSAAGGTAMATGQKTKNGVIGMDTSGLTPFKTILELAEENGLSTGLVSTSSVTHATPASFIAHQISRKLDESIAQDFLNVDIEVFIGGGYDFFGNREDGEDLVIALQEKGYEIDTTMEEVIGSSSSKIAGLVGKGHLSRFSEGRGNMLPDATKKAIEVLSKNPEGFFLMVEGSQIDWGGHANDLDYIVNETLDFDKAVGIAVDFAKNNPGTLIVVSADHETGGLTLPSDENDYTKIKPAFATGGHSAVMVPVFAWGTGAENFTGIMDNTGFYPRFAELYNFEN